MNTCDFCNKSLSTKSTLTRHLLTCKIKKERESGNNMVTSCELCNKILLKKNKTRHLSVCNLEKNNNEETTLNEQYRILSEENIALKEKVKCLQEQNDRLSEQNDRLSEQMFQLANKPTTTNNRQIVKKQINLINKLAPYDISEQMVQQIAEREYTEDDFKQGPSRLASFVASKIATNHDGKKKIVCTDYARRRFKYLNDDNSDVIEDIGANHLCTTIVKPMKNVISTTYDKIKEELVDEIDIDVARNIYVSNTTRLGHPEFVSDLAKRLINPED